MESRGIKLGTRHSKSTGRPALAVITTLTLSLSRTMQERERPRGSPEAAASYQGTKGRLPTNGDQSPRQVVAWPEGRGPATS